MEHTQTRVYLAMGWAESAHTIGIERYAGEKGWILGRWRPPGTVTLQQFRPHGIISQLAPGHSEILAAVKAASVPTVELCNAIPEFPAPRVMPDTEKAGAAAAAHLIERGFTRFVYIGNCVEDYVRGFTQTVRATGADPVVVDVRDPHFRHAVGDQNVDPVFHDERSVQRRHWARRFFSKCEKPVGVCVVSQAWAIDIIDACREARIRIPEHVAIVAGTDLPGEGASFPVPLSVVAPNYEEQAYLAAALLDRMMKGEHVPPRTFVRTPPYDIVPRESTFCYASDDLRMARATTFIMRNLHNPGLCVKQVCRAARIPRHTLYRRFPRQFNMSVARYIEHLRLQEARRLLATTAKTAAAIASQCGFGEAPRLRGALKRATGKSPATFRHRHLRGAPAPAADRAMHIGYASPTVYPSPASPSQQPAPRPESRPESPPEPMDVKVLKELAVAALGKKFLAVRLGHKGISGHLKKVVHMLLSTHAIEWTIPRKPNSRLQQYRLTRKGRDRLATS